MKYVNDFGIKPSRGTAKSVGLDFYFPDASKWTSEQINKFLTYLTETGQYNLVNEAGELSVENLNFILMYISLDSDDKGSFKDWLRAGNAYCGEDRTQFMLVKPCDSICVPSGIRTLFNPGYCGIFFNKSGMGKKGWVVKAQVIDEDYTGYVHINLVNTSNRNLVVAPGNKLSQLIELPAIYDEPQEIVSEDYFEIMNNSERGDGAFASTGI